MTDLTKCPNCGGEADNGHDRCMPPNVYYCTKCEETPERTVEEILSQYEEEAGTFSPVALVVNSPTVEALLNQERQRREEMVEAIEKEVGGFIAGAYAMKFEHNSREAKFWDVWKDGYEQCRKDALNAIKYESRRQD